MYSNLVSKMQKNNIAKNCEENAPEALNKPLSISDFGKSKYYISWTFFCINECIIFYSCHTGCPQSCIYFIVFGDFATVLWMLHTAFIFGGLFRRCWIIPDTDSIFNYDLSCSIDCKFIYDVSNRSNWTQNFIYYIIIRYGTWDVSIVCSPFVQNSATQY